MREDRVRAKQALILSVLEKLETATICNIASYTAMHRITAAKYLRMLEQENAICCTPIGKAKVYSLPKAGKFRKMVDR